MTKVSNKSEAILNQNYLDDSDDDEKRPQVNNANMPEAIEPNMDHDVDENQVNNNVDDVIPEINVPEPDVVDINPPSGDQLVRPKIRPSRIPLPTVGQAILYKTHDDDDWNKAKVASKGGKAGGKNWAYLNLED